MTSGCGDGMGEFASVELVAPLAELLQEKDSDLRLEAVSLLFLFDREVLNHDNLVVEAIVEPLIGMLRDSHPTARENAARILGKIEPLVTRSIPYLIALLQEAAQVQNAAAAASITIGPRRRRVPRLSG